MSERAVISPREYFNQHLARFTEWRRDLHAHPEIAFEEHRTAAFVAQTLRSLEIEVHEGLAKTGVVGVLQWGLDEGRDAEVRDAEERDAEERGAEEGGAEEGVYLRIGLRADLDALPMSEEGTPPHRSIYDGKMHACGHDGHTIMLLAAAEYLKSYPPTERGKVVLIFQPAEENLAGGKVMVDEGLFERFPVDEVYGLHNLPGSPHGQIMARVGPQMASADFFSVTLRGEGGHAAWPHRCTDVILAASQLIQGWQSLISRSIDPLDAAVLSVTQIQGGESSNVLPSHVTLTGTVRALREEVRVEIERGMRRHLDALCLTHSLTSEWVYEHRYTATINEKVSTQRAIQAAQRAVGFERVDPQCLPLMGAEDFGWMLRARSGCYVLLGAGDRPMLHHPEYDFLDDLIPIGAHYWVELCHVFFQR